MEDGEMSTEMEMNESPLLPISDHNSNTTRQNNQLRPVILLYWSMQLFIAGAGRGAAAVASLSRVPSYGVLSSTDAEDGQDQDLEMGVVDDADGPDPAVFGHNNSSASQTDNIGVELQRQRRSFKKIFREKNLQSLNDRLGGVAGVAYAFNSHLETGISDNSEEISQRKMVQVSQNWALAQNYLHFLKKSCKLWCMVLLFVNGVLSLPFGIMEEGLQTGWVDGAIVFVILFVLLLFSSIRNWSEARTARKKSHKEQILQEVGVVRGGKEVLVSVSDLVYGDLVCLKAGCLIPADGLFVCGEGLEIDDGTLCSVCNEQNPFLFYGSRVVKGSAKMLVISEGVDDTVLGEMMREALALSTQKKTNTETKIDKLSECINVGGLLLSILICVAMFLRFVRGKIDDDSGNRPDFKGAPTELERILHSLKIIFTVSKGCSRVLTTLIGVSLVGLTEGILFVVAIAIRHWNSKTLSDRASAKDELSCVRMAEVTTICIENNVGWLKEHRIEVGEVVFVNLDSDVSKAILRDGIGNTSTPHSSAMDQPLLSWAEKVIGLQRDTSKKCCTIVENNGEVDPFKKPCGVLVERITDSGKDFDVHFKGPAHSILGMCSFYYDNTGKMAAINEEKKQQFAETMEGMQGKYLQVIAYASKSNTGVQKLQGEGLTFLGMFGLKHTTSQQETRDRPIASLLASGIKIILFSQHDDVSELIKLIISREIGINETDAADKVLTLTGDELQQCGPDEEMFKKLASITVVGKCNSKLKQRIVRCLRSKGEVVAVVGERSCDVPVMKEADIGLAIKSEYSEITTQSANVIIMKGSFSLLIDMIICGRIINENLQKFIQVDVIMTIANSLINFISAVSSGDTPLSPIQLSWIYFLISFPGGLALLSGQPNKNLQDTIRPTGPLITKAMWVNILLQSSYQIAVVVTLQLKGTAILGISQEANESMIFNAFVFCQLFNIFSARGLKELNIFKGIGQNPWFWVGSVTFVMIHLPFDAVYRFIAGDAGLNWKQWLECCLIWAVPWLMDLIAKFQITEIALHWAPELVSTRDWLIRIMRRSTSMSLNASAPSESMSNLQNPLMAGGSTANTVQSNSSG